MNGLRTVVLLAALTALLVWLGDMFGGRQGAIMALIFAGAMNFASYWFSDKMVIAMYRGREIGPNDDPELYGVVQDVAVKARVPMPRVYAIPQETPNAFATGRNPEHAAVAVTDGIRRLLTKRELAGVLGHELAHVVHRDILVSTIAATLAGVALVIASACVLNNVLDRDLDRMMARTQARALAAGTMQPRAAVLYAAALGIAGGAILLACGNLLALALVLGEFTVASILGYVPFAVWTVNGNAAGQGPVTVAVSIVSLLLTWALLFVLSVGGGRRRAAAETH